MCFLVSLSALCKGLLLASAINTVMNDRKLCAACHQRPAAINYKKNHKTHYRSVCDVCNRKGKKSKTIPPAWFLNGYRKKSHCEKCGFIHKIPEQTVVFHVDGDLKNNKWTNLKTVCLNCQQEIFHARLGWRPSPIVPDF